MIDLEIKNSVEIEDEPAMKKWVSVDSILRRLKDARTSQGYKDNYYAIETELERGE